MKKISSVLILLAILASFALTSAHPVHADTATPSQTVSWYGEYFNNIYLIGPPVLTRYDNLTGLNWSTNSPGNNVPTDNFSARWGADPYFTAGNYRFAILVDDAITITIDFHNTIINTMDTPHPGERRYIDVTLTEGNHHIQVDYRELTSSAYIYLSWSSLTNPTPNTNPPPLPTNEPAAYVNSSRVNVRSGPTLQHSILTVVTRNTVVRLIGRNADSTWLNVRLDNNTVGWISAQLLVTNVATTTLPIMVSPPGSTGPFIATVNTHALNIRSGPGYTFGIKGVVSRNATLNVLNRNVDSTWLQVNDSRGISGWVSARYILLNVPVQNIPVLQNQQPPSPQRTHIVKQGETLYRIAIMYGVNLSRLAQINNISNMSLIYVGQKLIIPSN